jgi:histone H3/H4
MYISSVWYTNIPHTRVITRFRQSALFVIQKAYAAYVADYFQDVNLVDIRGDRVTIKEKYIAFVRAI